MISKLSAQKCCTITFGAFLMSLAQLKRAAKVQQLVQLKAHVNLVIKTFLTLMLTIFIYPLGNNQTITSFFLMHHNSLVFSVGIKSLRVYGN